MIEIFLAQILQNQVNQRKEGSLASEENIKKVVKLMLRARLKQNQISNFLSFLIQILN